MCVVLEERGLTRNQTRERFGITNFQLTSEPHLPRFLFDCHELFGSHPASVAPAALMSCYRALHRPSRTTHLVEPTIIGRLPILR
jgi:hypothetical protein